MVKNVWILSALSITLSQAILGLGDDKSKTPDPLNGLKQFGDKLLGKGEDGEDGSPGKGVTAKKQPEKDGKKTANFDKKGPYPMTIKGTNDYDGYFVEVAQLSNGDKIATAVEKQPKLKKSEFFTILGKLLRKWGIKNMAFGAINQRKPQGIPAVSFNEDDEIMIAFDYEDDMLRCNLYTDQFYICKLENEQTASNVIAFNNGTKPETGDCQKCDKILLKEVDEDKLLGLV